MARRGVRGARASVSMWRTGGAGKERWKNTFGRQVGASSDIRAVTAFVRDSALLLSRRSARRIDLILLMR